MGIRFSQNWFIVCLPLVIAACQPQVSGRGRLSLQLPEELRAKFVNTQTSQAACFAVSLRGEKIPERAAGSCDMSYGQFAGLAPIGGQLSLEAEYGSNRTLDIYYIYSENGCQNINIASGLGVPFGTDRVHLISRTQGLEINQPEMNLEVEIQWPSTQNSFATLLPQAPSSCRKGPLTINAMAIRPGRMVQGAAFGQTANGSQIFVRVIDQNLNIKSANDWTDLVLPVRLGEEEP